MPLLATNLWHIAPLCVPATLKPDVSLTRVPLYFSIIVETDSTTIASRVSRPKADTTEIVINEQTIMNAYQTVKEKMQQRIGQL